MNKSIPIAALLLALVPVGALQAQDPSIADVGWYNGYCAAAIPGWANWYTNNQNFSRVFDDFVAPAGGWTLTGVFSVNSMSATGVTLAAWEIRSGVSLRNGGTVVASGVSPATAAVQTDSAGRTTTRVMVDGLYVQLPAGTYWLNVSPVVNYTPSNTTVPPSYVCATLGVDAVGAPAGNDDQTYFFSTATGADFTPARSMGAGGFSGDFSQGVLIPNGATVTLRPAYVTTAVGWYNGDCQPGIPGWANWFSNDMSFSRVYEDFVVPADGWTITGVFSLNTLSTSAVTQAAWEIRSGVSAQNGGAVVASGVSPATVQPQSFGGTRYFVQVDGLNVQLPAGTYWLSVTPVLNYMPSSGTVPPSYVCATKGTRAIGSPAGNDNLAYFLSTATGAQFSPIQSTGSGGSSGDFSLGVLIRKGAPQPPSPLPSSPLPSSPSSAVAWYNGNCQSGIPGWANWYSGFQQFSRIYDNFIVPGGGWTVTGVFSINAMSVKGATTAVWEIRRDVSAGNSGTVVASGMSPATQTLVDWWPDGESIYRLDVQGLHVQLQPGTYWLSVAPVVTYSPSSGSMPPAYVCATRGTQAIGDPQGNDSNAFWDSLAVPGSNYVKARSSGGAGVSGDFSLGITISDGAVAALNPSIAAIVNAASWKSGAVSPGQIITIFGTDLGPQTASTIVPDPSGTVTTAMNGVRVLFGNIPAPQLYVGSNQINAVVPYEVAGAGAVPVTVVAGGKASDAFTVTIADAAPALFSADVSGKGQGAILNQDYSYNGLDGPARKGSYVSLFLTGEGLTTSPRTGEITAVADAAPWTPQPVLPVTVEIGGQPAIVSFNGEAPNIVSGMMQVNVKIPETTPSGNLPITVSVGGKRTQDGITVAVQD